MPDYDFYHGLYSGQQVDSAVSRALVGGQLDQDIAAIRAAVGSPLVATTAAEMTNINKIYVYTGSEAGYSAGHWYYYEGGSWQDGGLYNSAAADDEMSDSSTNAVQNKVIKEYVDDVRTDLGSDIADARTDLGADILAEQTRAENVEALKAPLASPALTGTPTAPTAAAGTANTQIATTAYADNAVAVEKARAEAVEATKADKSYADYILLREEEDRQILFGSIVEAAEDEYSELRSAPIHNAITIGGSVYPRMDRTRMAIDAIKGRTVAFNQLVNSADMPASLGLTLGNDGYWTGAVTTVTQYSYKSLINPDDIPLDHVIYVVAEKGSTAAANFYIQRIAGVPYESSPCVYKNTSANKAGIFIDWRDCSVGDVVKFRAQYIDLTEMYGTTLADSIYAMEQATAGAGVAYVRARMDSDYYAANAGELKAPVVSGVGFVGFNVWDEVWEVGGIDGGTGDIVADNTKIRSKNYIPIFGGETYYFKSAKTLGLRWYDENKAYINAPSAQKDSSATAPSNARYLRFIVLDATTYANDICINLSKPTGTPKNGDYRPYLSTSLSLPSTRLDGVGTAQDTLFVREDAENDYSIVKTAKMNLVDMGDLNWTYNDSEYTYGYFQTAIADRKTSDDNLFICSKYVTSSGNRAVLNNGEIARRNATTTQVCVRDDSYSDAATFKTAMNGVMLAYELATTTETVLAEHLTLAEISAIAENGGIISMENSNGHIVQPDFVADVVISRSAS